jgi:hypothetical protein
MFSSGSPDTISSLPPTATYIAEADLPSLAGNRHNDPRRLG